MAVAGQVPHGCSDPAGRRRDTSVPPRCSPGTCPRPASKARRSGVSSATGSESDIKQAEQHQAACWKHRWPKKLTFWSAQEYPSAAAARGEVSHASGAPADQWHRRQMRPMVPSGHKLALAAHRRWAHPRRSLQAPGPGRQAQAPCLAGPPCLQPARWPAPCTDRTWPCTARATIERPGELTSKATGEGKPMRACGHVCARACAQGAQCKASAQLGLTCSRRRPPSTCGRTCPTPSAGRSPTALRAATTHFRPAHEPARQMQGLAGGQRIHTGQLVLTWRLQVGALSHGAVAAGPPAMAAGSQFEHAYHL